MDMEPRSEPHSDNIAIYNSFLRGELSAVETFRQALDKIPDPALRTVLEDCARSHQERVVMLNDAIRRLGGTPSAGAGAWGAFAKLVEGGAKGFGIKSALAALEEGEDRVLADYKRDVERLDDDGRRYALEKLMPAQEKTRRAIGKLKKSLH
jgi:hypothetical protein